MLCFGSPLAKQNNELLKRNYVEYVLLVKWMKPVRGNHISVDVSIARSRTEGREGRFIQGSASFITPVIVLERSCKVTKLKPLFKLEIKAAVLTNSCKLKTTIPSRNETRYISDLLRRKGGNIQWRGVRFTHYPVPLSHKGKVRKWEDELKWTGKLSSVKPLS